MDTSSGTRKSRSFAFVLSTTVTAIARTKTLRDPRQHADHDRRRRGAGGDAGRHEEIHQQREIEQLLDRRGPLHQREVRPCVFEDHGFVDHRQLEVRGGIVDWNASRLGDDDDEEAGEGEDVGRVEGQALRARAYRTSTPRFSEPAASAEVNSPSISAGSARAAMVMSRLAPMPPNGLPVSSAAVASAKRPERERAHQQEDAARRFERRRREDHRHQRRRGKRRGEVHARTGDIDPGRRSRIGRVPSAEASPDRSSPAASGGPCRFCSLRLHLLDHGLQQRGGGEHERALQHRPHRGENGVRNR